MNKTTPTILLTFALGLGAGIVSPSCATGDSETLPEPDDEPRVAELIVAAPTDSEDSDMETCARLRQALPHLDARDLGVTQ